MSDRPLAGGTRARRAARPESRRAEVDPGDLTALEEQRDFLLRSIEDLEREHDAGEVAEEDYVALRDDYTAHAADAIRALESRRDGSSTEHTPRSWARVAFVVAVVAVFGLGAGLMVARSSGTSGTDATTDTVAANPRQDVLDLLTKAQEQTTLAEQYLQAGNGDGAVAAYQGAIKAYDDVLKIEPANAEAMTYRGWLLHNLAVQTSGPTAAGLDGEAMGWLDRAVQADPTYPDARIFRAILLDAAGRPGDAMADLDAVDPASIPSYLTQLVTQRRAAIQAELDSGAQTAGT